MGNISNILGGSFAPPLEKITEPPEIQLKAAMLQHGITPPDVIEIDGQIHRFSSGTKGKGGHGDKTGWYVLYGGTVPCGVFGCWRLGVEINFRANIGRKLSIAEEIANNKRMSEAKTLRDVEVKKSRERAASTVEFIWEEGTYSTPEHGYLARKGIQSHGSRVTGDGRLMVPLFDEHGKLSSIQYIGVDGEKKYHPGGATGERYWSLGDDSSTIYIAEGFATAATINEVTNKKTIVAYSASNLVPVTRIIKEKYPTSEVVIVADNDESGVGLRYAEQAGAKYGARVVMPPDKGDANDYVVSGKDLMDLLIPKQDDWLVKADDFSSQPSPISWLVKGWIQEQALVMVHGPSGGGKTFLVLDWCLSIASDIEEWFGNKVKNGDVVYLAGEGHHGLRGRIAAWKQHKSISTLSMWLSRAGCDLNTAEGYQRVVSNLRSMDIQPKIIVVDTLHRFLNGDENSSQDAKTMLDACGALISEFNCSVLLVHHTGVDSEAQHRARGSSAWRGALDIEVSIVPSKDGQPIEIVQRKSKDAELRESLYCELLTIPIDNWYDEDGEQVTSAVVSQVESEGKEPIKNDIITKNMKCFAAAWKEYGAELYENLPYISRSALAEFLEKEGLYTSEASVKNALSPAKLNGFIGILINAEVIKCRQVNSKNIGFFATNNEYISQLLLSKN